MTKIKIGLIGLGRLGMTHAINIATKIEELELRAICSLDSEELTTAQHLLKVPNTYINYTDMLDNPELDAIVIASPSHLHCQQMQMALQAGKHVFCEKPIGLELKDITETLYVAQQFPKQTVMIGFMRRVDPSYLYAKKIVEQGTLGELTVIRCYGIDPSSKLDNFATFAANNQSGGIFADMAIHDIDLIRWFSGQEISRVWALGKIASHPKLQASNELETGTAMMELTDKTMAFLVTGRNAAHGYHVETELIGTKGMLRIGNVPEKNLVTLFNENGAIRPCSSDFPERFEVAFINELQAFGQAIHNQSPGPITALDGFKATKVAQACQLSFDKQRLIDIN